MKIQALQVGPIGTNCYIFCDEGAKVCGIVDPGGEPEVILDAVKKLGCTVDKILLTHGRHCCGRFRPQRSIFTRRTLIFQVPSYFP